MANPLEALRGATGIGAPPSPEQKLKQTWDTYGGMMGASTPLGPLRSTDILRQVIGPRGSAQDLLGNPKAMEMMEAMHKEANPVFRKMQQQGMFGTPAQRSVGGISGQAVNQPAMASSGPTEAFQKAAGAVEAAPWRGLRQLRDLVGF